MTRLVLLTAESLGHVLGVARRIGRVLTGDRPDQLDQLDQLDRDAYPKAISAAMMDRQRNPDKWLDATNPMPEFYNPDDWSDAHKQDTQQT